MTSSISSAPTSNVTTKENSWLPSCPSFRKVADAASLIGVSYLAGSALYNSSDLKTFGIYTLAILGGALYIIEKIKAHYRATIRKHGYQSGYLAGRATSQEQAFGEGWDAAERFQLCTNFAIKCLGFASLPAIEELQERWRQIRSKGGKTSETLELCHEFLLLRHIARPDYFDLGTSPLCERLADIAQQPSNSSSSNEGL